MLQRSWKETVPGFILNCKAQGPGWSFSGLPRAVTAAGIANCTCSGAVTPGTAQIHPGFRETLEKKIGGGRERLRGTGGAVLLPGHAHQAQWGQGCIIPAFPFALLQPPHWRVDVCPEILHFPFLSCSRNLCPAAPHTNALLAAPWWISPSFPSPSPL